MALLILYRFGKPLRWFADYVNALQYLKVLKLSLEDKELIEQYYFSIANGEEIEESKNTIINKKLKYYGQPVKRRHRGGNR